MYYDCPVPIALTHSGKIVHCYPEGQALVSLTGKAVEARQAISICNPLKILDSKNSTFIDRVGMIFVRDATSTPRPVAYIQGPGFFQ